MSERAETCVCECVSVTDGYGSMSVFAWFGGIWAFVPCVRTLAQRRLKLPAIANGATAAAAARARHRPPTLADGPDHGRDYRLHRSRLTDHSR